MSDGFRLSPIQERMIEAFGLDVVMASRSELEISGVTDQDRAFRALERLVEPHEILRSGLVEVPGLRFPLQIIGDPEIERTPDLTALRRPAALGEARALRALWTPQLLRVSLPSTSADRGTLARVFEIFADLYGGRTTGEPGPMYADAAEEMHVEAPSPARSADFDRWPWLRDRAPAQPVAVAIDAPVPRPELLEACWAHVIARWSGCSSGLLDRVVRDTPSALGPYEHGRAVAITVDPELSFGHLARHIADATAAAGPARFGFQRVSPPREIDGLRAVIAPVLGEAHDARLMFDGFRAWLEVDSGRVGPEDATRIAAAIAYVLRRLDREAPLRSMSLGGTPIELHPHADRISFGPAMGVDHLILAVAESAPERPAIVSGPNTLTYAALAARSERWARALRARNLEPQSIVSVTTEAPDRALTAMLAAWMADLVPAPLDPEDPPARRQAIPAPLSLTDADLELLDQGPLAPLERSAGLSRGAYVLLTSGSSGAPKPVLVEHGALIHYLEGVRARIAAPPAARFGAVTRLSADLAYTAVFLALTTGGTLVMPPARDVLDVRRLREALGEPLDVLKTTPSLWAALAGAGEPIVPRCCLVLGGEPITVQQLARVRQASPTVRVLNHYGPTEATVGALVHHVDSIARRPPIGRPLPGVHAEILDPAGEPVGVWEPGELHLGGPGLAREYVGDPQRTAERFIERRGRRLYATGDLVRSDPSGVVEHLGRIDRQLKINGVRIEPAEIEAALLGVVLEAAVAVEGDVLVAYVVPRGAFDRAAVDRALAHRLAPASRPARVVPVGALPRTPSGKIDARALAALAPARIASAPPRTPLEHQLVAIWRDVLEIQAVGVDDDFFELGGHSLIGTQIVNRVRESLGVDVTIRDLYDHPTVAAMAQVVGAAQPAPASPALVRQPRR